MTCVFTVFDLIGFDKISYLFMVNQVLYTCNRQYVNAWPFQDGKAIVYHIYTSFRANCGLFQNGVYLECCKSQRS